MIKVMLLLETMVVMMGCTNPGTLQPGSSQEEHTEVTASNLVRRVVKTLADSRRSGSLIYQGSCAPSGAITDSFRVVAPEPGVPVGQTLHDAFANEPRLTVGEDAGRVRVIGGKVRTDLLDFRISQITFHSEDNPRDATTNLLNLPEVKAYMQAHHIEFVSAIGGIAPERKGVRLSATLKNATVSDALDRISQSFPGVWIYAECDTASGERFVDFTFVEF
jgi:hypothetical protein